MTSPIDRRQLIQRSLTAAVAGSATAMLAGNRPALAESTSAESTSAELKKGSVILFQGDSITDARRDRKSAAANHPRGLGSGYPAMAAAGLLRDHPGSDLQVFNRGISGNKVPDLKARWQQDCVELKPTILSILIGVNDIWHKLNGRYDGTVETYREGLQELLTETADQLPDTRIVICEPFVLKCGAVNDGWFPEFDERRQACLDVAKELALQTVRFQTMFDEAVSKAPPAYWAADGVHPTIAGHSLMAQTWRTEVGI